MLNNNFDLYLFGGFFSIFLLGFFIGFHSSIIDNSYNKMPPNLTYSKINNQCFVSMQTKNIEEGTITHCKTEIPCNYIRF